MKKHKNRILRAVRAAVFLFVLALMILGLDKSLKLIQEDNLCPRYYEYPKDTFDVAFLGASLVMYGIYPVEMYDEYGIASYSLTTGNQSIEASYYLAKEVIEKDHPSLIVLDCSFASSDEKKMEPQYIHYITDTMPYLNKNRLDIIRNLAITDDYKPLLFPLIAFHSRWQELTYGDFLPQTKEMVYGAKITGRVNVTAPYDEAKITPGALSEQSRSSIEKIIRLCRENDTGLMLLTMPVPGKNKFFDQDGYNLRVSAAAEVDELAKKNGILHANFVGDKKNLEDLGLDLQMDAYDGEHLNRWGAAKFTRTLGKYIKAHFDIPDRRGQGGAYSLIDKDLENYPVNRMRDSLQRSIFLRDYAASLHSDVSGEPVEDALILVALNGKVDDDILTEEEAALLRSFGLSSDLHSWEGHGWLAVIDGGRVVYETALREDEPDFMDSFEGESGKLRYQLTSGRIDEETEAVHSAASIVVNGLEYATEDRGLHFAVFRKSTGELMDSAWLDIHSYALEFTHDLH